MSSIELRQLRAFGHSVTGRVAETPRDLRLLGIIDETLEALDVETENFRQLHNAAKSYVEMTKACVPSNGEKLEELVTLFEEARDAVHSLYEENLVKRQAAVDDDCLSSDDGIVDGYDTLLNELAALHNCINELAWVIGEHAADSSEVLPGRFSNADDLFKALGA